MFFGQSSFILEGRKVGIAERRRHNDWLMWSYDLMFANYYESKFAWRLTFSLDLFSCYSNSSSAQRRLSDFTASTCLPGKISNFGNGNEFQALVVQLGWKVTPIRPLVIQLGWKVTPIRPLVIQLGWKVTPIRPLVIQRGWKLGYPD